MADTDGWVLKEGRDVISPHQRFGQYLLNALREEGQPVSGSDVFYASDERVREVVGRWGWLRLVPTDMLAILDTWASAIVRDGQGYTTDRAISEHIAVEIERRAELIRRPIAPAAKDDGT